MRKIETVGGNKGYRHQLDRVRRFLDRVEGPQANDVEFQDMMWALFQNCWHLKDWVKNDPLASDAQKDAVIGKAHESDTLKICRDLCNGTKHLGLDRKPSSGVGAAHHHIDKQLARDCVAEWERILQSEQLNITRRS